ncbi:MAG TPA: TatD family hydrolase [bacterium]|nr:TatD family hydrolase [bacterium]HOL34592.1 TatD family hydrolase [bacterium]HPP08162.1 TatD family hydrolase [bacterium]
MFADTHCHLDFPDFDADRKRVIEQAFAEKICLIINPGTDLFSSKRACEIAREFDFVYAATGIHPHNAELVSDDVFYQCMKLVENNKVIAIGETGLDFFYQNSKKEDQIELFRKHIRFATKFDFPLIVHQREAENETIQIFESERHPSKVVFHCFSGDEKMLEWVMASGFYVSFTGIITFRNAANVRKLVEKVNPDRVFFETDAPYLAPHPYRGKRNEPRFVRFVVEEFARIKKLSTHEIAEITTQNAMKFFGIKI